MRAVCLTLILLLSWPQMLLAETTQNVFRVKQANASLGVQKPLFPILGGCRGIRSDRGTDGSNGTMNRIRPRHRGVDWRADRGTPVVAPWDGVVLQAGNGGSKAGNLVTLSHANNVSTRYLHLDSIRVKKGQRVKAGTVIGTVGRTGFHRSYYHTHLHFEVFKGTDWKRGPQIVPHEYFNCRSYSYDSTADHRPARAPVCRTKSRCS